MARAATMAMVAMMALMAKSAATAKTAKSHKAADGNGRHDGHDGEGRQGATMGSAAFVRRPGHLTAGRSGEVHQIPCTRERSPVKSNELEQALILLLQNKPSLSEAPPARRS